MFKIYQVVHDDYDVHDTDSIFTSEEAAQARARELSTDRHLRWEIEVADVFSTLSEMKAYKKAEEDKWLEARRQYIRNNPEALKGFTFVDIISNGEIIGVCDICHETVVTHTHSHKK